ncbi:phage protein [Yersinia phage phiR1-RT]|uniref:Phage protein n=1 Tax=Yersinia phage phiR1-RT TaxID=1206558 RepID=I7LEL6_BPPR1|nr:hypothetical protein BN80_118 [Yersinia phage phiR1-RT]CCI88692.1 phage protein [Yersinia phage phiR1-RT]
MKYLTAPYLTLMNAFNIRSEAVLSKETGFISQYSRINILAEYRTLRIDGGRQSGKTEAVALFASDWIQDGGHVICLADSEKYAYDTVFRIRKKCDGLLNLPKDYRNNISTQSIRAFLSDSYDNQYRGVSMKKILIIIDEPCRKMPDIFKFYNAFENKLYINTVSSGKKLPLFIVLGMQ